MQGSNDAYDELMRLLQEVLPSVARQIQEQVAIGRLVPGANLDADDKTQREQRMREVKAGRTIGNSELATVEFTGDEKLALVLDALQRLSASMRGTRQALKGFADDLELPPTIRFTAPDGSISEEVNVTTEADSVTALTRAADERLRTALAELSQKR